MFFKATSQFNTCLLLLDEPIHFVGIYRGRVNITVMFYKCKSTLECLRNGIDIRGTPCILSTTPILFILQFGGFSSKK